MPSTAAARKGARQAAALRALTRADENSALVEAFDKAVAAFEKSPSTATAAKVAKAYEACRDAKVKVKVPDAVIRYGANLRKGR